MKTGDLGLRVPLHECRLLVLCIPIVAAAMTIEGCTDRPPPAVHTVKANDDRPHEHVVESPKRSDSATPYRAKLRHGAELYLPPWFMANRGRYDVIMHFHGLGKLQERNLDRCPINAAVVSINMGVGTNGYSSAFRDPRSFNTLLDETAAEIEKTGRAENAHIGRIALSAWSAGFVSVAKIMSEPSNAEKIDAVVLADGFFTSFTNVKKRVINTASLERFVALVDVAARGEKLFAITHSAIPTQDYPSVEETVSKLLEMTSSGKTPSTALGPRKMQETYLVERGAFHVTGYEGVTAGDHIKQIQAMGETLYPRLKARWEQQPGAAAIARTAAP